MRAVAVRINLEAAVGGFVLPNDRVDVIHTDTGPGGGPARSTIVVFNARVIAIDPLFGLEAGGRLTLMPCPATRDDITASVHALLARTHRVSVIADSPGFVCQRILAVIVNIACDICQQGIGSPEDVDAAVKLGLGYPEGPLAWGDALGTATIIRILDGLHAFYRDPRYRPSPLLTRRNLLGRTLTRE
jgi:3-hydroxybutyryl-CoA dehydrogenase